MNVSEVLRQLVRHLAPDHSVGANAEALMTVPTTVGYGTKDTLGAEVNVRTVAVIQDTKIVPLTRIVTQTRPYAETKAFVLENRTVIIAQAYMQ